MGVAPRLSGEIRPCSQSQHHCEAAFSGVWLQAALSTAERAEHLEDMSSWQGSLEGVHSRPSSNLESAKGALPEVLVSIQRAMAAVSNILLCWMM